MAKGNLFVKRYVMACAISIVISMVGMISLLTLPVEQYPDIAPPMVSITTDYYGADAASVMRSVVVPIEESVNGVEGMTYITSNTTSTGNVEISVYFKQGTNADMAAVNVQNRVSKVQGMLPSEVTQIGVKTEKQMNSILQMAGVYSADDKYDEDFISNYVDINVRPRLLRINGVGNVTNLGNTYALRIWLKPDVMAQYGLTPNDVFASIRNQSFVAAAGNLGEGSSNDYQFSMEYKGTLKEIQEFEQIVIRTNDKGHALHLGDVAKIEIGAIAYNFTSSIDGHPGSFFFVNQAPGANATQVNAEINKLFEDLKPTMPAGLEFKVLMTSDDFLFAAIHNVVETLVIAIILVVLVVYFFLQSFKATIIPTISIIVSLLGTFTIVQMAGFSLNIITLFGLVLAIGTVVDDAIVVVEAVMAKLESGVKDPRRATNEAMSEVTTAVFSCTLVFMAVFLPVTFMPGTSGAFFTQFGITLACSVGLSCVSALTFCPAMCAILLKVEEEGEEKHNLNYYTKLAYTKSYNAMLAKYKGAVSGILKRPFLAVPAVAIAGVLMYLFMSFLPSGLVPQEDQGVILCEVRTPEGSTLHETTEILKNVVDKAKQIPELESVAVCNGYGMLNKMGSNYSTLIIRLKNWDERPGFNHYIDLVIARFYMDCLSIKNVQVLPFQMPQIPGYGSSNSVDLQLQDLTGEGDMEKFAEDARKFCAELTKRPEVADAAPSFSDRFPKYTVEVDPVQCDRAGVSAAEVINTLGAFCGSSLIGNFNQFGKVYRIMANASPEYRLSKESLDNMFLKCGDGKMAPLSQFVTLKEIVGSTKLNRFNLYPSISAYVSTAQGYAEGQVHVAIKEVFDKVMPKGYGYEYGSMSRELEENANSNATIMIYGVVVLLIYLILASLYNSWFVPFAVLLSVPFGLMGSFGFSYLSSAIGLPGMENNIYLQTGVIMLMGLLAKTAILITEFAGERRRQGLSILEAATVACEDRFRPILMTCLSMVIGMIPLIIAGGAGANGNRALAIGVTGGMVIGTIALLFVVPAFFILFQTLHEKFQGIEFDEKKPEAEEA